MVRRRLGHRLVEIADLAVVAFQHRIELAELQLHQGAVPPQVMDQLVAERPVAGLARQPIAPLARPAFHLQHMRLDVMREIVGAVLCDRLVDGALGARGVPGLLMGKGPDRPEQVVARQFGGPARRQAIGLLQDLRGVAVTEPARVADAHGEQIDRVGIEELAPDRERTVERAAGPGRERSDVLPLAIGRRRCSRLGGRQGNRVGGAEQQIALEAMPQNEMRVGGEQLPEQRRHIGMEFEVMLDSTVEQRCGFRAVGRERQAAFVSNH